MESKEIVIVIFSVAESYFISVTRELTMKIDSKIIVSKHLENPSIIASFNAIRRYVTSTLLFRSSSF